MKISIIAAVAKNKVIGRANDLPWHLPDDMKYFMQTTKGHHVIMGRKNYDSLPAKFKPLPHRTNVVLTRQQDFQADGCVVVNNLKAGIDLSKKENETELFIIGGAEIYAQALPFADLLYLTEINEEIEGDTFFPDFEKTNWKEISRLHHPKDEKHNFDFDFVIYQRK